MQYVQCLQYLQYAVFIQVVITPNPHFDDCRLQTLRSNRDSLGNRRMIRRIRAGVANVPNHDDPPWVGGVPPRNMSMTRLPRLAV